MGRPRSPPGRAFVLRQGICPIWIRLQSCCSGNTEMTSPQAELSPSYSTFYCHYGKRWFDIACALVLLLLCLVPMILIALAVRLFSGLPVLFRQVRAGLHGEPFVILKFRTMFADAEKAGSITVRGDARVTPLGGFLRRHKLDELPQLWNVLVGDM